MKLLSAYFTAMLVSGLLSAQSQPTVTVGKNMPLPLRNDSLYTFECHLSTHPLDRKQLLATVLTIDPKSQSRPMYTTILSSPDTGKSWKLAESSISGAADPWGLILPNGDQLLCDISTSKYNLITQRKANNSSGWTNPNFIDSGYDHGMLIADYSKSAYNGNVYLVATRSLNRDKNHYVLIARSTDQGRTFAFKNHFYPFKNVDINAKTPVILSDGTLVVPIDVRGFFTANENEAQPFEQQTSWICTSNDGGRSFSAPRLISPGAGRRHNIIAVNKAPKFSDELYYVFVNKLRTGILFTKSSDKGESWTRTVQIDSTSTSTWKDLGAVAVSPDGTIGIVYSERVDAENKKCYNTFFTASIDGGVTFTAPVKLNSSISCPDASIDWFVKAWPQGGDYCGLVSTGDRNFLAMWSDARIGVFRVYQAEIRVE